MSEPIVKRLRTNYSNTERKVFSTLLTNYKDIIENKKPDCMTLKKKESAWKKLTAEYNTHWDIKRSVQQLKWFYDKMKRKAKKNHTNGQMEKSETEDEETNKVKSPMNDLGNTSSSDYISSSVSSGMTLKIADCTEVINYSRLQSDSLPKKLNSEHSVTNIPNSHQKMLEIDTKNPATRNIPSSLSSGMIRIPDSTEVINYTIPLIAKVSEQVKLENKGTNVNDSPHILLEVSAKSSACGYISPSLYSGKIKIEDCTEGFKNSTHQSTIVSAQLNSKHSNKNISDSLQILRKIGPNNPATKYISSMNSGMLKIADCIEVINYTIPKISTTPEQLNLKQSSTNISPILLEIPTTSSANESSLSSPNCEIIKIEDCTKIETDNTNQSVVIPEQLYSKHSSSNISVSPQILQKCCANKTTTAYISPSSSPEMIKIKECTDVLNYSIPESACVQDQLNLEHSYSNISDSPQILFEVGCNKPATGITSSLRSGVIKIEDSRELVNDTKYQTASVPGHLNSKFSGTNSDCPRVLLEIGDKKPASAAISLPTCEVVSRPTSFLVQRPNPSISKTQTENSKARGKITALFEERRLLVKEEHRILCEKSVKDSEMSNLKKEVLLLKRKAQQAKLLYYETKLKMLK